MCQHIVRGVFGVLLLTIQHRRRMSLRTNDWRPLGQWTPCPRKGHEDTGIGGSPFPGRIMMCWRTKQTDTFRNIYNTNALKQINTNYD